MLALARAHSADWVDEAVEVANAAVGLFVQLGDRSSHARALQLLCEIYISAVLLDEALQAGESSIKLFHEIDDSESESQSQRMVESIKNMLEKNPAIQSELAQKQEVQREIDLLILGEVASALSQRNVDDFK